MLKKTVKYTDYNGVDRTEDFYFNLTEAEVTEMELCTDGGMAEMIQRIVAANDTPTLVRIFKDLVLKAYGEKSADGKRFIKSDEISTAFSQTEAYSQIFMELSTNAEKAAEFINGIFPTRLQKSPDELKKELHKFIGDVKESAN